VTDPNDSTPDGQPKKARGRTAAQQRAEAETGQQPPKKAPAKAAKKAPAKKAPAKVAKKAPVAAVPEVVTPAAPQPAPEPPAHHEPRLAQPVASSTSLPGGDTDRSRHLLAALVALVAVLLIVRRARRD
jgi:hypothetical protein